ncbi:MAG TPA: methyltransferase domain-containing protein [Pyrinomonadaceae bacterium]|nr:methyltransferase domain-containing protein [Pyrinomonadaceae bacterium]
MSANHWCLRLLETNLIWVRDREFIFVEQDMNPNKALWEKGDFTQIADTMRQSADELIEAVGVEPGMKVLDLGCGDGNTAIPSAKRGAEVLGVDIAGNLVEAATKRAADLGVSNCRFQEGDASDLNGIENDNFDLTISIFGAMFAPRPFDVAKEMVRVTKPGGRVVMGNWIPGDPTLVAQILRISSAYSPPPPEGFVSPMLWGVKDNVVERFGAAGVPADRISFSRETYTFEYSGSPSDFVDVFRTYYGPTMNAFDAASANGKDSELLNELRELFANQNRSGSDEATSIPATYLRVTVNV